MERGRKAAKEWLISCDLASRLGEQDRRAAGGDPAEGLWEQRVVRQLCLAARAKPETLSEIHMSHLFLNPPPPAPPLATPRYSRNPAGVVSALLATLRAPRRHATAPRVRYAAPGWGKKVRNGVSKGEEDQF